MQDDDKDALANGNKIGRIEDKVGNLRILLALTLQLRYSYKYI